MSAWHSRAKCVQVGAPTSWFFEQPGTRVFDQAVALCQACSVRAECARAGRGEIGLWGGKFHGYKYARRVNALEREVGELEFGVWESVRVWQEVGCACS